MSKKTIKKTVTTVTEEVVENYNNKTEIICILDRSGSMSSIIDDAIGGFNSFIDEQKKLDEPATVTVALFDDQYELLYDNVDLKEVKRMKKSDWLPRGMTALYDAIGRTINTRVAAVKKMKKKDRPDKFLVVIVTDGHENASSEFNQQSIFSLIDKQKKNDWQFIFLAANQDAMKVGTSFGISAGNTLTFTANSTGTQTMYSSIATATKTYRSMNKAVMDDAQYAQASMNLFTTTEDGTVKDENDDNT